MRIIRQALVLGLVVSSGCVDPEPDPGVPPPDCTSERTVPVTVTGTVIDFSTKAPVAGASVDLTSAWDGNAGFPGPKACPVLATVETRADGKFGPVTIDLGADDEENFVLFLVDGSDRAPTASDNRICTAATCTLDHTIAAPSVAVAEGWRAELAAGGMEDADTRGLIAFEFREPAGTPAERVVAEYFTDKIEALTPGAMVRYVNPDRASLAAASTPSTTASGLALVGAPGLGGTFIGGHRDAVGWQLTGCLMEPGWIFLEDRRIQ
ncbi:MAG TPA: hypothetical protein VIU61_03095 [Kofleriaceae bacterium]